ncbi:similar to Saccharomyces cerevisiae YGR200C ELP2 Subunit of Elongator complex, which is required for modification of wobble nucleosides in tRNA [Maudiozyma barnettii]|uniref:Elongator complex protein 2 n=1 Tax=Maudiozyma barnettii TaxID=61262 RepID=A0A8H2VIQ8_9SACH|nr:Elongator subunit ELP2 [Kazachstania barnettii]CAB4256451.1 similar to Saccharomyces cerevisiae YGR200C ELP2 Subunit of Elongator complex, which is required for modification of wobble nucleosides in tRNA [Kazachstania barnettii]CAD1785060.1 similar to Saccharomyces cerevisiae YGR200C ELP2 Subunit of Elongator complex, which is required for modification of wobble nucleosides in tRNA [Kazachstania barnettii]
MSIDIEQKAIFVGANQQNQTSDYNKQLRIVAFGAGRTVALWNPLDKSYHGITQTLKGHESTVTCVRFIHNTEYMVSTSEDCHIKIWKFKGSEWNCVQTITQYSQTIVALGVLEGVIAIGCANGMVSLWYEHDSEDSTDAFQLGEEFEVEKNVLPLSLSLSKVEKNKYLLAVGGTNIHVFIYSFILDNGIINCKKQAKLEGHEDWVKSLAFRYQETPGDYLLCSGSQDRYIRIWRIRTNDLIKDDDEDENTLTLLNNKQYKFNVDNDLKVCINFEALIMGHDDWISSLQWHETRLQLLASTADTSLMVWEPDESSGIWVSSLRLGEISSKGASTATGSSGGFWSCIWFNKEGIDYILTNGKTGAWRVWSTTDNLQVDEHLSISGPTKEVTDIAWSPNGEYLLSTSLDQTTRLYAPWLFNVDGSKRDVITWHEFSRPQIHGYDMICVEPISDTRFLSGGDEKIVRSFDEPKGVAELLKKFVHIDVAEESAMPESAALPVLGLSNKATGEEDETQDEDNDEDETAAKNISYEIVTSLTHPPIEDQLQRHLLWPEIEKLYGHGYEITCLDVSPDRKLIASACRSNTPQHAVIRIFSVDTWLEIKPTLALHSLTINKLRFSPDNKYLLAVCRDRKWSIWERKFEDNTFTLKCKNEKPHTRIIWDGDWAPLEFGNAFVTGSRDRTIKIWNFNNETQDYTMLDSVKHDKPVTALSVFQTLINGKLLIAAGLEDGSILLYYFYDGKFQLLSKVSDKDTPADKLTRLRWSTMTRDGQYLLGAASSDNTTRIYSVTI